MLAARRVAVRAAAAAMTSYAATNQRARSDRDGPVRDDSVYDHPPFALRQLSRTEPTRSPASSCDDDDDGKVAMLRRHFPAAPRAELRRFADARPDGGAEVNLYIDVGRGAPPQAGLGRPSWPARCRITLIPAQNQKRSESLRQSLSEMTLSSLSSWFPAKC